MGEEGSKCLEVEKKPSSIQLPTFLSDTDAFMCSISYLVVLLSQQHYGIIAFLQ